MSDIANIGSALPLARTDSQHLTGVNEQPPSGETQAGGFGEMLIRNLEQVNSLEQTHQELSVQSIINPDSVNPHDVTIAASKANMALSITKAVVDRALQAYQEIKNLR
jgi:flagellar hook-basal body complex protein FliE